MHRFFLFSGLFFALRLIAIVEMKKKRILKFNPVLNEETSFPACDKFAFVAFFESAYDSTTLHSTLLRYSVIPRLLHKNSLFLLPLIFRP